MEYTNPGGREELVTLGIGSHKRTTRPRFAGILVTLSPSGRRALEIGRSGEPVIINLIDGRSRRIGIPAYWSRHGLKGLDGLGPPGLSWPYENTILAGPSNGTGAQATMLNVRRGKWSRLARLGLNNFGADICAIPSGRILLWAPSPTIRHVYISNTTHTRIRPLNISALGAVRKISCLDGGKNVWVSVHRFSASAHSFSADLYTASAASVNGTAWKP